MSARRESRREHWDRYWDARPVEEIYPAVGEPWRELLRWRQVDGARALEVGTGSGRDSLELARRGAAVTVLDYSEPALRTVRRAWDGGLPLALVRGDARRLPFADGSFDLVFHQGLLEHFRDPASMVVEHARVLAPGGVLLIDVPQRWHAYTAVKRLLIALDRWFAGWERSFSARELEGLMAAAGLEILGSYASWPEPGLAYRALRLALARLGLRLPAHPRPLPLLGPAGARLRAALRYRRLGHYTGMVLGTVARRPGKAAP